MNLVSCLHYGDNDLPARIGVIFQALSAMFQFSSALLHNVVIRGNLP